MEYVFRGQGHLAYYYIVLLRRFLFILDSIGDKMKTSHCGKELVAGVFCWFRWLTMACMLVGTANVAFAQDSRTICGTTVSSANYAGSYPPWLDGAAMIYSSSGLYLGLVSSDLHRTDSILNPDGSYGSSSAADSMFNASGSLGDLHGTNSPCNSSASNTDVPQVSRNGVFVGYLTKNAGINPAIDPAVLVAALLKQAYGPASANSYTLTISELGAGSGTVISSPAGINCGTTCSMGYHGGTSVTMSATADIGSIFSGWSGGGCSGTGSCTVNMTQTQNVTATFITSGYTLSISELGAGSGTVISSPAGINCGTTCSMDYASGTSVTLGATANAGSTFTGWSGGGCSGTFLCIVSMNQAQNVIATFTSGSVGSHILSVTELGTGTGTVISNPAGINCGTACSMGYPGGTSVTMSATADIGSIFSGWSGGGCSGTFLCIVSMNQAQNVTATFTSGSVGSYTLSVTKSGSGSGTMVSSPTGINCGTTCSMGYPSGTSVTLGATANAGSTFTGWSGGGCSGTFLCTVNMSQAQNVTATFTLASVSYAPGPYDGIYQWDAGYYLSMHQISGGTLIGTIYWVYTSTGVPIGSRTISEADTFDLFHGQIVGSSGTMSGTRFYRACTLSYDLNFNSDSSLTVRLTSVSNSLGVSTADVNCAARYNSVGSVWTIPRIY